MYYLLLLEQVLLVIFEAFVYELVCSVLPRVLFWDLLNKLIPAFRDSKTSLIFFNNIFCLSHLNLLLDILFRFDLDIFFSFFAFFSFILPDCIFLKSSIPLLKSSNLFLK